MTEYLKAYIAQIEKQLLNCSTYEDAEHLFKEHKDKIAFMQHERIVHFLVTMMFALVLAIFIGVELITENLLLSVLIIIIIVLLAFYIKHYYFLENTVQYMYVIYDNIIDKLDELKKEKNSGGEV